MTADPEPIAYVALLKHRAFFIIITFAAVLFLSDIWIYKEFVRAESYFALGSRLMVEQGEWLLLAQDPGLKVIAQAETFGHRVEFEYDPRSSTGTFAAYRS